MLTTWEKQFIVLIVKFKWQSETKTNMYEESPTLHNLAVKYWKTFFRVSPEDTQSTFEYLELMFIHSDPNS